MKNPYGNNHNIVVNSGKYLKNVKSNHYYSHNDIIGNSMEKPKKTNIYEITYYEYIIYDGKKFMASHHYGRLKKYCRQHNCEFLVKDYYVIIKDENNKLVACDIMLSNKTQDEKYPNMIIYKKDKIKK